jgi:hypothetical protein
MSDEFDEEQFIRDIAAFYVDQRKATKQINIGKLTGAEYSALRREARKREISVPQLCREAVLDRYSEGIERETVQRERWIAKAERQLAELEADQ